MTCSGVYQNAIKVQKGNFSSLEFFYFWINNIPLIFQDPFFPDYFLTTFTCGANFLYFINHKFNYCYLGVEGVPCRVLENVSLGSQVNSGYTVSTQPTGFLCF